MRHMAFQQLHTYLSFIERDKKRREGKEGAPSCSQFPATYEKSVHGEQIVKTIVAQGLPLHSYRCASLCKPCNVLTGALHNHH